MFKFTAAALAAMAFLAAPAMARIQPFPGSFHTQMVETNGTSLYVRVGGTGPGGGHAARLRRYGRHVGAARGRYSQGSHRDRARPARHGPLGASGCRLHEEEPGRRHRRRARSPQGRQADLVTHDIGNMVGYALAAQIRRASRAGSAIDAPLPGIGDWDNIISQSAVWHFNFRGPDVERLVQGRERIYLDRFWNELSADPKAIDEADAAALCRALCAAACHARRVRAVRRLHSGCGRQQGAAGEGRQAHDAGAGHWRRKILRHGDGRRPALCRHQRNRRHRPTSGHWIMEENPQATIPLVTEFLAR